MQKRQPLSLIIQYVKPYKFRLLLATITSALNKMCDIVPEILIGISIDVIVNQSSSIVARCCGIVDPYYQLYMVATLTAIFWVFESIFEYIYLVLWRSLAQRVQHALRTNTYKHMQTLDMAYFEQKTTGELLTVVNDDINQLELFLSEGPNAIIQLAVNIIVMGGIFTVISPTLAGLTLIPIPFVITIAYYFQHRLASLYQELRERVASLSSHIASRIQGITTIKSYTTEHYEAASLRRESKTYQEESYRAGCLGAAYIPIVRMGVLVGFIMSLFVGGTFVLEGTLPISLYSALVFLSQRFLWPFTTLTTITDQYERAMASTKRIQRVLQQHATIVDGKETLTEQHARGTVTLHNVSFKYQQGPLIFENLSLEIPAQHTVAFVGTTGSGKSTIVKLLLRFYDVIDGSISLGGTDIKQFSLSSLRSAIGLVSQDVYLTNDTVANNISYGTQTATREEVVAAAQAAEAHEFIIKLPNGYDTHLGENGKNLSGGQRQRLAIARALLKNPPLFIFDEATSALDNETEAAVQRSIRAVSHNHTTIIIAHRLSTVRHADTIFVLEHGAIKETGNHDDLIKKNGAYAALWRLQTGETR